MIFMKRFLLILLFSYILGSEIYSQSIYQNTIRNSLTTGVSYNISEDISGPSFVAAYTLNSSVDLSLGYTYLTSSSTDEIPASVTKGFSGGIGFLIVNELREAPFSLELGLLYSSSKNQRKNNSDNEYTNTSFGGSLTISKKLTEEEANMYLVPQFGLTFVPVSETDFDEYNQLIVDKYMLINVAVAAVAPLKSSALLLFELGVSYNLKTDIPGFNLSMGFSF